MRRVKDDEVRTVVALARAAVDEDPLFANITAPRAVSGYVDKADEVRRHVWEGGRVLDWGCGSGLMSYLLARRSLEVVPIDRALPRWVIAREAGLSPIVAPGRAPLPFEAASFEAVVSCGVLEHVADPRERLMELRRVLKPDGYLFIYSYPNRLSWIEWLTDRIRGANLEEDEEGNVIGHQRKLRAKELADLIRSANFRVLEARTEDVLPLSLRVLPAPIRRLTSERWRVVQALDQLLLRLAPLRAVGTNVSVLAIRP